MSPLPVKVVAPESWSRQQKPFPGIKKKNRLNVTDGGTNNRTFNSIGVRNLKCILWFLTIRSSVIRLFPKLPAFPGRQAG